MAIITISRGTFSGGKTIAERVAERLGYPCVSGEVILDAAKEYGIPEAKLTAAMEKSPAFWEKTPGKRTAFLNFVAAALLERVKDGNLVYHGHAGHLLLRDITHVLRVRVIGDTEYRIIAAMERKNFGRDEAITYIEKVDKKRVKWTRSLYGMDWQDASLYDIVLNLERMSVESACEMIIRMTGLGDFTPTATSQKALQDMTLSSKVLAALAKDDRTKIPYVTVVADGGKVTISGNVSSGKVIDAIPSVARRVEGVKEIVSKVGIGSDWYW